MGQEVPGRLDMSPGAGITFHGLFHQDVVPIGSQVRIEGVREVIPVKITVNNCGASLDVIAFRGVPPAPSASGGAAPRPRAAAPARAICRPPW